MTTSSRRRVGGAIRSAARRAPASAGRIVAHAVAAPRRMGPRARRAALVTALVLALLLGLGAFLYAGPLLRVETVEITGVPDRHVDQVRSAAAVPMGEALLQVDAAGIADRVRGTGVVRDVVVRRRWPSTIVVATVPRAALVVVRGAGEADDAPGRFVDADGVAFEEAPSDAPGVPVARLERPEDPASLRAAAGVVAALRPDQVSQVDRLVVGADARVRFWLGNVLVAWGGPEDGRLKAAVLAGLAQQADVRYVDVTVPMSPVTSAHTPSALGGPSGVPASSGPAAPGGTRTQRPTRPESTDRSPGAPADERTRDDGSAPDTPATSTGAEPTRRQ